MREKGRYRESRGVREEDGEGEIRGDGTEILTSEASGDRSEGRMRCPTDRKKRRGL